MATEQPTAGFTLNNVMAPVLYKLIHYFMENPISGRTVLKHPVVSKDVRDTLILLTKLYWLPSWELKIIPYSHYASMVTSVFPVFYSQPTLIAA